MDTPAALWRSSRRAFALKGFIVSAEAITGIVALALTAIGVLCGGVWWMSALYGRVCSIQGNTRHTAVKLDTLTEKMDGELRDVRKDITDLQVRMVVVEGAIDTEEE